MTSNRFLDRLQSAKVMVLDGATGTNLQRRGLPVGTPSDLWVMDQPDKVLQLYLDFVHAGSDIILTNTFGSSRLHLSHAGISERFVQTNCRAVELARQAVAGTQTLVAGSMGPLGEMLEPLGTLSEVDAEAEYAAQARLLAQAGVDLLVIETQFDITEAKAAVRGARSVSDLPLVCSFSYDRGTRTMMGVKPAQMARELAESGVCALGINCGKSLEDNLKALQELRAAANLPIWFKPNAGLPHTGENNLVEYDVTPEVMGSHVSAWIDAGARLVGGCCGTSPEHLAAIARAAHG